MSPTVTLLLLVTFLLDPSHAFFWSRLFGSSSPSPPSSPASSPGSRSAELTPSWDSGADSLTWREAQQWCEARGLRSVGEIIINRPTILYIVHRAVSVDTEAKAQEVLGLLSKSGMDYFWTSGIKESDDSVRWANEASGRITPGSYPW